MARVSVPLSSKELIIMSVFSSADILLPRSSDLSAWSVIACDQYTSDMQYWQQVRKFADGRPSTLELILPESMLSSPEAADAANEIEKRELEYLSSDFFAVYENSYILTERLLPDGSLRRGLIGKIDLEEYEYEPSADAALKASERTVYERLLKRFELQRSAPLDLPHVLVFADDRDRSIEALIASFYNSLPVIYDFELMQGGGHITGRLIKGIYADKLSALLEHFENSLCSSVPSGLCPAVYAVGDGNHSLASAKQRWKEKRESLADNDRKDHPARFSLVELVNVYDDAISILPIHRVVTGIDCGLFTSQLSEAFSGSPADSTVIRLAAPDISLSLHTGRSVAASIAELDSFISSFTAANGGSVDYVHDDEAALGLAEAGRTCAILFPPIERSEIFDIVREHDVLPKKCFSIGHAWEKRYYLEARSLTR